eukprot:PITA_12686
MELGFHQFPVSWNVGNYFDIKLLSAFIFVLTVAAWSFFFRRRNGKSGSMPKGRLPPGPFPLPIIGNLHLLGDLPHRALAALSKKYGPLMSLRLGSALTLVVSSPDMAKEFLKTNDRIFASRSPYAAAKYLTYNSLDVVFAPLGPYWRQMRKVCVLQVLHSKRIEYFRYIREEEVSDMIRSLLNSVHQPVNITKIVSGLVTDIMCRMAFGRKYSDQDIIGNIGFVSMVKEIVALSGSFNIGDYIPYLAWMDLQGFSRRFKKVRKLQDDFLEKVIDDHAAQNDANAPRDLVDVLIAASVDKNAEFQPSRDNIKAVLLDMLAAGTDTSSTSLDWTMVELLKNPPVMKKLQGELERVVGFNRMVSESDLPSLVYLQAVVKESLRLHPAGPFGVPHASVEDCTILGYQIPKGTRLLVNLWQIATNPESWGQDADTFNPERFMEAGSIDSRIQNFEWLPFGGGRRGCPGQQLGTLVVEFAVAQLVHCFNWKLPEGMDVKDLDMTEKYEFTMPRSHELFAVPTTRFAVAV